MPTLSWKAEGGVMTDVIFPEHLSSLVTLAVSFKFEEIVITLFH